MKEQLLTINEAAKLLKVSTKTLRRWEKQGKLIAQRTKGNQRRYSLAQITAFRKKPKIKIPQAQFSQTSDSVFSHEPVARDSILPETSPFQLQIGSSLLQSAQKYAIVGSLAALLVVGFGVIGIKTASKLGILFKKDAGREGLLSSQEVLAAESAPFANIFKINIPTRFSENVDLLKDASVGGQLTVQGKSVFVDDILATDHNLDLGAGLLTASNVLYRATAGTGISITGGQNITITNTDPGSAISTFKNFAVGSTTLTAGSPNDILTIKQGTGITLSSSTSDKSITLSSTDLGPWTVSGTSVVLKTTSNNVGIGNTSAASFKLQVAGNVGPDASATYDLGSASLKWNNLYVTTVASGVWNGSVIGPTFGGTGISSYAIGDLIYASAANTLSNLTIGSNGKVLTVAGGVPSWGSISGSICTDCVITDPNVSLTNTIAASSSGAVALTLRANTDSSDILRVTSRDSLTRLLTVTSNGNVGIGTTSPGTKLDVVGWASVFGNLSAVQFNGNVISTGSGTLTFAAGKTLTVNDTTTLNTNSISLAGGESVTFAANKSVSFADAFQTSGANSLVLTTTAATNVTLPPSGTLLTSLPGTTAQTITPTQTSGTLLALSDTTNITAAIVGQSITLSGTGAFDQTGLQFNLSGASGTNLNDIVGTSSTWKVSRAGDATFNSVTTGNVSSTGTFLATNGSASAPSFSFTNSTHTGLFRAGADILGISSNSTERVRIDSVGNVGIGTTSPIGLLDVEGAVSGKALVVLNYTGTDQNILVASKSGTTKFVIDNTGTITTGIWQATPIATTSGGTGMTAYLTGDLIYGSAVNTLNRLGIGSTNQVLSVSGGVPAWATVSGAGGLCSDCVITDPSASATNTITPTAAGVTALTLKGASTDNANIFTVKNNAGTTTFFNVNSAGNINTGTWQGTAVAEIYGGTNQTAYNAGDILYASAANTLSKLPKGSQNQVLSISAGGLPVWATGTGGGGFCSDCVVSDPTTSLINTIAASASGVVALTLRAPTDSTDIFQLTSRNAPFTTYLKFTSAGDVVSNDNFVFANGALSNLYKIDTNGNSYFAIDKSNKIETGFVNGNIISTSSGTLTLAAGKTLTANSTLTLAGTDGKTLTVNDSTTLATNSITFAGTESLTLTALKSVSFADVFQTSGANSLILTTTAATNVTLPPSGTLLTSLPGTTAQTITPTQTSGTLLAISDTTNITNNIIGQSISLSGTGGFDQTGLKFNLSGATGNNLYDVLGSLNNWGVYASGAAAFKALTVSGSQQGNADVIINQTNSLSDIFTASQGGTTKFVITNAGNVGIGTSAAPGAKLEVNGQSQFDGDIGLNTAPSNSYGLVIGGTNTATIANSASLWVSQNLSQGGTQYSIGSLPQYTAATTNAYALFTRNDVATAVTVTNGYGLNINAGIIAGTGQITTNYGINVASLTNLATASTANTGGLTGYGVAINLPNQGGNTSGTDTNYGLYLTGNGGSAGAGGTVNNYSIYNNSTAASYFAGNVGIGTTAPATLLDIQGSGGVFSTTPKTLLRLVNNDTAATNNGVNIDLSALRTGGQITPVASISGIMTNTGSTTYTGALAFSVANTAAVPTEAMRIIAGGNVGIGTTAPTGKFVVSEPTNANLNLAFAARGGNSLTSTLIFGTLNSSGGTIGGSIGSNGALGAGLAFKGTTAGIASPDIFLDTNGNLGIGTTSPGSLLDIQGSGGVFSTTPKTLLRIVNNDTAATNNGVNIDLSALRTGGQITPVASISGIMTNTGSTTYTGALAFSTAGTAAIPTERMRIDSSGNVGIGTTSPGALLDVGLAGTTLGVLRLAGNTSGNVTLQPAAAAGTWTFTLPINGGTNNYALTTNGSGTASWSQISLTAGVTGVLPIANGGTNNSTAYTAGSVIFSNGTALTQNNANLFWDNTNNRLGLGTTAPATLLDIQGSGGVFSTTPKTLLRIVNNDTAATNNGVNIDLSALRTGGQITPVASISGIMTNTGSTTYTGALAFSTAGTAAIPTERVRIDSAGNVGIGTTSILYLLSLYGTANNTTSAAINVQNPTNGTSNAALAQFQAGTTTTASGLVGAFPSTYTDTSAFARRFVLSANSDASGIVISANSPGQDIRFIAGSVTERMRLDSNGNLGIGTTAPLATLHVKGTVNTQAGEIVDVTTLNDLFTASASGATKFVITNAGNVGIGSTLPSALFTVGSTSQFQVNSTGAIAAATGITSSGGITFSTFSSNGGPLYTNGTGVLAQATAGTATQVLHGGTTPSFSAVALTTDISGILPIANGGTNNSTAYTAGSVIFSNGTALTQNNANLFWDNTNNRLGIGTTAPATLLDIQGSGGVFSTTPKTLLRLVNNDTAATNNGVNIDLSALRTGGQITPVASISGIMTNTGSTTYTGALAFSTAGTAAIPTERMRIDSSGNVGIGTTSPGALLHVLGGGVTPVISAGTQAIISNTAGTSILAIAANSGGAAAGVTFGKSTDADRGSIRYFNGTAGTATEYMAFAVAGEKMRIDATGNVGIGTSAPGFKLDVQDTQAATAAAQIYNTNIGNGTTGLIVKLGVATATSTNYFVNFLNGNGQNLGKIRGNGTAPGGANTLTYDTNGGDYAEYFKKKDQNETIATGDLVCLTESGVTKCAKASAYNILGVVSATAGFVGAGNYGDYKDYVLVGLLGQLPVKVSSTSGSIKASDPLTVSKERGIAQKATTAGQIVGRALGAYDPQSANSTVMIALHPSWYDPDVYLTDSGDLSVATNNPANGAGSEFSVIYNSTGGKTTRVGAYASLAVADLKVGSVSAQMITTPSIAVTSDNLTIAGAKLSDYIASSVQLLASSSATLASSSATINPPTLDLSSNGTIEQLSNQISSLNDRITSLSTLVSTSASTSALLSAISNTQSATTSALLSADQLDVKNATVSGALQVLGRTVLSDVGITGNMSIGVISIHGLEGEINTIGGPLKLQNSSLEGVEIAGGKVKIDKDGNVSIAGSLTADTVSAKTVEVLGASTTGTATMSAGLTTVKVPVTYSGSDYNVFITPRTLTDKQLTVTEKGSTSFTVKILTPDTSDIHFDWWIVGKR